MKKFILATLVFACFTRTLAAQTDTVWLLQPDRVFDGENMHTGWVVLVKGTRITFAGMPADCPRTTTLQLVKMPGATLLPGLIEGHSHLFLHPYNETNWNDQVLNESRAERTARAVVHAKATLLAGFTTVRDLGTEGAGYDDVGLKKAIEKGIIPGPRMIVATRAIVATGSYGPKLANTDHHVVKGAAEADGVEGIIREVRTQIGNGADVVKLYADYRWGPDNTAQPTFTTEELKAAVEVAASSGRKVAVHASTAEGMRRAAMAGVTTIEHGDNGTAEVFALMKEKHIAYCPTLSATEAITSYDGWRKGIDPEPARVSAKHKSFSIALQTGVTICFGGDVGVFSHGDNAREMEAMVGYGMQPIAALRSATSVNADVFGYGKEIGRIGAGKLADIIAVKGNPSEKISDIRHTAFVMKDGIIYLNDFR